MTLEASAPPASAHICRGGLSTALTHGIPRELIGTGVRSEDVADAVLYMLTRPSHVNIRDLVILPVNQEI